MATILEDNGKRFTIDSEEDWVRLIGFAQKRLAWMQNAPQFDGTDTVSAGQQLASIPFVSPRYLPTNGQGNGAATPRSESSVMKEITAILESGSNAKPYGNPPPGQQGIDFVERALTALDATKESGKTTSFGELCLQMLKLGWGTNAESARTAVATVATMARNKKYSHRVSTNYGRVMLLRPLLAHSNSSPAEDGYDEGEEPQLSDAIRHIEQIAEKYARPVTAQQMPIFPNNSDPDDSDSDEF